MYYYTYDTQATQCGAALAVSEFAAGLYEDKIGSLIPGAKAVYHRTGRFLGLRFWKQVFPVLIPGCVPQKMQANLHFAPPSAPHHTRRLRPAARGRLHSFQRTKLHAWLMELIDGAETAAYWRERQQAIQACGLPEGEPDQVSLFLDPLSQALYVHSYRPPTVNAVCCDSGHYTDASVRYITDIAKRMASAVVMEVAA